MLHSSPDCSPIANVWSKVKGIPRSQGGRTYTAYSVVHEVHYKAILCGVNR